MKHKYRYPRFRGALSHDISYGKKVLLPFLVPLAIVAGTVLLVTHAFPIHFAAGSNFRLVSKATLETVLRIICAYVASVIVAYPIALLVTMNRKVEHVTLPIIDILESIPVLAFFPIIIIFFIKVGFLEGAAFFVLAISMLWSIVFSLIGGVNLIPQDIKDAAQVFGLKKFAYFRHILLPALVPELVTGSILAVANGWNIIIVAEVLHTYIAGGTASLDLFGLGSLLVQASATNNTGLFVAALSAMVLVIAVLNVFVWQKLLRKGEMYRFE